MKKSSLALAALLFASTVPAMAKEVAGKNIVESTTVDGKTLRLNGAGIRKKFIIKVYIGALYTEAPASNLNAIISTDMPRKVEMTFLRSVDKEKIMGAFKEGFENNSKDKAASLQGGLDKIAAALPAEIKEGQVLYYSYSAGKSTVGIQGGASATVEGKDFGDALLKNYLGDKPADANLKQAMLGG
jgi:hypothetical protein